MIVTAIERQKRDASRFSVFIDHTFAFGLSGVDLLYHHLEVGTELTEPQYDHIIEETVYTKARDKAVRFIGHRLRSRKEIYDRLKLSPEDYSDQVIERVLTLLEEYGYVDDDQFAQAFCRDKSKINGFGSVRLRYELRQKGIDSHTIDRALSGLALDEPDMALSLLEKKYRRYAYLEPGDKRKAFDYLLRKGFTYEIINQALKDFTDILEARLSETAECMAEDEFD